MNKFFPSEMKQNGLAPILIVILIALALGVGGYVLYNQQSKPTPPLHQTNLPSPTTFNSDASTPSLATPTTTTLCLSSGVPLNPQPFKRELYTGPDGKQYYRASGVVRVKGLITVIPVRWYDQETNGVFIRLKQDDVQNKEFYDEYINQVETGNTVNKKDGTDLLFKLGELKDGSLITTADVSSSVKNDIEKAIDSGTTVELSLSIPLPPGRGAGPDTSFACLISKP